MTQRLERLLQQLVNIHPKYIDLSLDRLFNLLTKIDNPHLKLPPIIHIAGTNGKGSVLSFIRHILIENHFSVHAYISPHLKSFNERIIISNKQVSVQKLYKNLEFIKKINSNMPITFFEITTAAAFHLFSQKDADFLLLETGLGGRLDATNVVKESLIDIITPISLDHQEFLGKNIKKIIFEKLGIIKPKSNIIISKQKNGIKRNIKKLLKNKTNNKKFYNDQFGVLEKNSNNFKFFFKNNYYYFKNPKLNGVHQIENAATAITAIFNLKELGYKISKKSIDQGLTKTKWPGRLEKCSINNIPVYLDGAHNVGGAIQLVKYFKKNKINRWLILGMLNNKDLESYLKKIKPIIKGIIAIKIPGQKNSFSTNQIKTICDNIKITCHKKNNIKEANDFLIQTINPNEILVSGSLYLIGKIRKIYL